MDQLPTALPGLLTDKQVAATLGICTRLLREHVKAGRIAYVSVGGSVRRPRRMFHPDDVVAFINRQRRTEPGPVIRTRLGRINMGAPCLPVDFAALRAELKAERQSGSKVSARQRHKHK